MIPKSLSSTSIGDGNRLSDKIMLKDYFFEQGFSFEQLSPITPIA